MRKRILFLVMGCVVGLCLGQRAYGQATGSFFGTVTDKSAAAVVGASVTVTSQGTGASRSAVTDTTGHYIVNLLPVSIYTIRVQFQGFQPVESKDVKLQVDEQLELNFVLAPATVSAAVEVVGSAVTLETASPALGQVITSQEVAQLPLNGRDFVQLATLMPGATQETSNGSFFTTNASSEVAARGPFSLSVGGSRANSTDWLIDGVDNNELTSGGISILSSIDSLQEFKVLTYNYSAEYGTRAGPTVLLTTKAGTNDFHGSIFEFLRNTSLDAKSFFATSTEKFNLNQFGGAIGGPIRRNKTFFFVDAEQKYQRHGQTFTGLVPTAAMRNGDFSADNLGNPLPAGQIVITNPNMFGASSNPAVFPNVFFQCNAAGNPTALNADGSQAQGTPCNKIPQGLFANSIGSKLIALYPLPTPGFAVNGENFVTEPVRKLDETKFDVRLDHNFSKADSAFARFSYDQAVSYVPGGATGFFAEPNAFGSNQGIINHARNVAIGETHVFSATNVNQVSVGYNRIFDYITSQGTGSCESAKLGIPGANLTCSSGANPTCSGGSCGLTSALVVGGGYWSLGDRGFSPFQGGTDIFSINDSFDMVRGKHDIKVGVGFRINQMNVRAQGFQDGFWVILGSWTSDIFAFSGNAMADLLLGLPIARVHDQNFSGDITGRRWKLYRPFFQDDWRFNKDLTVNVGLAWSLATPISEARGRIADFIPTATSYRWLIPSPGCTSALQAIATCTNVGAGAGINMDYRALEPRIGLAWKVRGSEKTVVRAGYAIYHDSAWSLGGQGLWSNPPFAAESAGGSLFGCTTATAYCAAHGQTPNVGPGTAGNGISDGFPLLSPPSTPANFVGNLTTENTDIKQGTVQQFNFNVERQLPGQIVLTAGYAGSRSTRILNYGNNINVASPTACGTVSGYTIGCGTGGAFVPTPFPNFGNIISINDFGSSHYNSLQIKAETKSSRSGVYALIGYTYSRTYDSGYSDGLSTPIGAPYFPLTNWGKLDWALSQINLNNSFTASVIYDLPFGKGKKFGHDWNAATNAVLGNWQLTTIEKITSGFPIFVVDSSNTSSSALFNNGTGASYIRPDKIADPFKPGGGAGCPTKLSTSGFYFNPCAFAAPAAGELGNANRAPISGPGFVNTDFSVIKRFALPWENMGLDFRAEFFNLFNHPQFDTPSAFGGGTGADINAPSQFGRISLTVNNPRVVQFGLKLTF